MNIPNSFRTKVLQQALAGGVLALWAAYVFMTFLYVSPSNPIRDRMTKPLARFELVASQKWSFFAPPPRSNRRLYYKFFNEKSVVVDTFEVLVPITTAKRAEAPFNTGEEIIDYMLHGSLEQLVRYVGNRRSRTPTPATGPKMVNIAIEADLDLTALRTLKAYSKFVATRNGVDRVEAKFVSITCTDTPIPDLSLKMPEGPAERLVFRTTLFRLPPS
jgi:hypothetical protein